MFKGSFFKVALILGIGLRIILALFTYHPDVVPFYFAGRVIAEGHASTFYDFLPNLPSTHDYLKVYPRNLFNYPPAVYFLLGGLSSVTTQLIDSDFLDNFFFNFKSVLGNSQLYFLLLLLKLPYLFFDLAALYFIRKIFESESSKNIVTLLWLFNPINLYATYMMGQFDIIPTLFVICVLYRLMAVEHFSKRNFLFEAFLLGIGGAFKIFPLLLLVPLASVTRLWKAKFGVVFVGLGTYILSILPFINSAGFRATALVANQTTKSLYAQIPISGGESIILFIAVIIFLYIFFQLHPLGAKDVWKYFLLTLITFFVFTHFHPQWLLWLTPFLMLDMVTTNFKNLIPTAAMLLAFVGSLFFFDPSLTVGLFSPIAPALYESSGLLALTGRVFDYNFSRSILQSIFVGGALYYYYFYLKLPKKT